MSTFILGLIYWNLMKLETCLCHHVLTYVLFFHKTIWSTNESPDSDRGTEFKGAVNTFLKRSGIQNIESRPYHPQSKGKNERSHVTRKNQKETWYIKLRTWYNSFINKLINHECIDNKRNYKSITPHDHANICKFYKTLTWV